MAFAEHLEQLKKTAEEAKAETKVPEDHRPTEGEINNLCYLSMKIILGWQMRASDYQVLQDDE